MRKALTKVILSSLHQKKSKIRSRIYILVLIEVVIFSTVSRLRKVYRSRPLCLKRRQGP
jgi:hypothetical protein